MDGLTDSKTEKVAGIIREIYPSKINKLLVVGCGTGLEAAILAEQLNVEVVGIDIEENFDERAKKRARLQKADAPATLSNTSKIRAKLYGKCAAF